MSAPIPSFFKIRLIILIICFVLGCFLIGSVRNVFAFVCNDGTCYTAKITGKNYYTGNYGLSYTYFVSPGCPPSVHDDSTIVPHSPHQWNNVSLIIYEWHVSSSSWSVVGGVSDRQMVTDNIDNLMSYFGLGGTPSDDPSWIGVDGRQLYSNGCPSSPCQTERDLLSSQCGGEGTYYINEDTCEGHCTPTGNCASEYEQKIALCGGVDNIKNWDNTNCTGQCITCRDNALDWALDNCGSASYLADYENPVCDQDNNYIPPTTGNPCLTCADAQSRCEVKCGGTGNIEVFNCNDSQSSGGYQHIDSYTCSCVQPPKDCNDFRLGCEQKCGGPGLIEAYSCTDGKDPSTRICKCPNTPPEDGVAPPSDPPDDPGADNPADAPDPNATDSGLLSSIEQNTRSTVQNSKIISNQLSITNQKLDWIGDNNKIIADNTATIGNNLNDLTDAVNNLKNEDKSAQILQDISDGEFNQPADLTPYSDGKEEYNFSDRFNGFIDQMKTTAIFSLPNSISQNIPSGGSSVMTIDAGQYGTHNFDFSNWGNALLILRTSFLIVFSWVGIRIVLLKR